MENRGYLEIFRQRWKAIALVVALAMAVATLILMTLPVRYTAKATLFLSVQSDTANLNERSQFSLGRIASYPELVHSEDVLRPAIKDLELPMTVPELSRQLSAANPANTVLVEVTAHAGSAEQAAAISNEVAENLSAVVAAIESNPVFSVSLDLLIRAHPPASPSAPQKTVILGLGLVSGLAIGASTALVLARVDRRIYAVSDVRRAAGLPVLGLVPRKVLRRGHSHSLTAVEGASAMADIIGNIRHLDSGAVPRFVLLIPAGKRSSCSPQPVRLGLARAAAATGREVLLIETEQPATRRGRAPGSSDGFGLSDLLESRASIDDAVRRWEEDVFRVLPAGAGVPPEAQAERTIHGVMAGLLTKARILIAQTTPSTRPASLQMLAPYADVTVIVARYGESSDKDIAQAVTRLRIAGVEPVGVIIVAVPAWRRIDLSGTWRAEDFVAKPRRSVVHIRKRTPVASSAGSNAEGDTASRRGDSSTDGSASGAPSKGGAADGEGQGAPIPRPADVRQTVPG